MSSHNHVHMKHNHFMQKTATFCLRFVSSSTHCEISLVKTLIYIKHQICSDWTRLYAHNHTWSAHRKVNSYEVWFSWSDLQSSWEWTCPFGIFAISHHVWFCWPHSPRQRPTGNLVEDTKESRRRRSPTKTGLFFCRMLEWVKELSVNDLLSMSKDPVIRV